MKNSAIALCFAVLLAVGCGDKKDDKPGNSNAYQEGSNACSSEFITEMNGIAVQAGSAFTRAQVQTARARAVELKTKYAGVKCQASQIATGKTTTVNADETLDGIIRALDNKLSADAAGDDGVERGGPGAVDRD